MLFIDNTKNYIIFLQYELIAPYEQIRYINVFNYVIIIFAYVYFFKKNKLVSCQSNKDLRYLLPIRTTTARLVNFLYLHKTILTFYGEIMDVKLIILKR